MIFRPSLAVLGGWKAVARVVGQALRRVFVVLKDVILSEPGRESWQIVGGILGLLPLGKHCPFYFPHVVLLVVCYV